MWFYNINWLLVMLIVIASEIAIGLRKLNGHFDKIVAEKIEVKENIEVINYDKKHK